MASTGMGLVMVLVTMLWARTMAQSDCTNVLITLAPCLSFVSGSSSTPSSSCCSQLASVVKSQPRCLCTVLNGGGASLGVSINETLALALPGACHVQTPPVSKCNAADGPLMSPFGSPVGAPEALPDDTTAGTGSKIVPATSGSGSGSSNSVIMGMPLQVVLSFVVFMASSAYGQPAAASEF